MYWPQRGLRVGQRTDYTVHIVHRLPQNHIILRRTLHSLSKIAIQRLESLRMAVAQAVDGQAPGYHHGQCIHRTVDIQRVAQVPQLQHGVLCNILGILLAKQRMDAAHQTWAQPSGQYFEFADVHH